MGVVLGQLFLGLLLPTGLNSNLKTLLAQRIHLGLVSHRQSVEVSILVPIFQGVEVHYRDLLQASLRSVRV